jgi:hypothetical protein
MAIATLSQSEQAIVRRCIVAVLDGPFMDDPEFQTRLGIDRPTARAVVERWERLDCTPTDQDTQLVINNSMNEVVNGIRMSAAQWHRWIDVPRDDVDRTYRRWLELIER